MYIAHKRTQKIGKIKNQNLFLINVALEVIELRVTKRKKQQHTRKHIKINTTTSHHRSYNRRSTVEVERCNFGVGLFCKVVQKHCLSKVGN